MAKERVDKAFAQQLGRRIRHLREVAVLTQAGLAERANMSKAHLNRLEAGSVGASLKTLKKIADGLNVSLAALVKEDTKEPKPALQVLHRIVADLRKLDQEELEDLEPLIKAFIKATKRSH